MIGVELPLFELPTPVAGAIAIAGAFALLWAMQKVEEYWEADSNIDAEGLQSTPEGVCWEPEEVEWGVARCFREDDHDGPHRSGTPAPGQMYQWED